MPTMSVLRPLQNNLTDKRCMSKYYILKSNEHVYMYTHNMVSLFYSVYTVDEDFPIIRGLHRIGKMSAKKGARIDMILR